MSTTDPNREPTITLWEIDNDGRGPNTIEINETMPDGTVKWHTPLDDDDLLMDRALNYALGLDRSFVVMRASDAG